MSRRNDHPRLYFPPPAQPFQMLYPPPLTQPPPQPSIIPNEGQCPHCPDDLGSHARLMEHIAQVHPPRRTPRSMRVPTCEQCGATFNTANSLASHRSRYHTHRSPTVVENPVPIPRELRMEEQMCADCGRSYKSRKTLRAHRRKRHPAGQEGQILQQRQPQIGSSVASPQPPPLEPQPPRPQLLPPPQALEPRPMFRILDRPNC